MMGREDWNRVLFFIVVMGLIVGLVSSLLPRSFFYETDLYYSGRMGTMYGSRVLLKLILENRVYLIYFLGMRFFLPLLILLTGLLRKKTILPQLFILFELTALSFQAALIFGAIGMEGWFRYQLIALLPESFYLLAAIRVYFFKKQEIPTIWSCAACVFQILSLFLCGVGLEILL